MRWLCWLEVREGDGDIDKFLQLIASSSVLWLYLILFGSAALESLFPPYPGDTVIIVAGYLVGMGKLHFTGALLSSAAGSLTGASLLFLLGFSKGRSFFLRGHYPFLSPEALKRVESWFQRHGRKVVLASRFLAGVRSVVAVSAGIGRMRYGLFVSLSLVSVLVWNGLLLLLGLELGQNWERVARWFRVYNGIIMALILLVILVWHLKRRGFFKPWRHRGREGKEMS
jgi:membrane protein DedA with SNARE-associated domain